MLRVRVRVRVARVRGRVARVRGRGRARARVTPLTPHPPPTPTPARHSWYHKCPLNRLDTKTAGFFSGAALSNSSRGLAHSRPS